MKFQTNNEIAKVNIYNVKYKLKKLEEEKEWIEREKQELLNPVTRPRNGLVIPFIQRPIQLTKADLRKQERILIAKISSTLDTCTVRSEFEIPDYYPEVYDPVQREIDKIKEYNERQLMMAEEMHQIGVEKAIQIYANINQRKQYERSVYIHNLLKEREKVRRKNENLRMMQEDQFSKDLRVYYLNKERREEKRLKQQQIELQQEEKRREAYELKAMFRNDPWEQENRENERKEEAANKIDPKKVERLKKYHERLRQQRRRAKIVKQLNIFHGRPDITKKDQKLMENLTKVAINYPELGKYWIKVYQSEPPSRQSSLHSYYIIDGDEEEDEISLLGATGTAGGGENDSQSQNSGANQQPLLQQRMARKTTIDVQAQQQQQQQGQLSLNPANTMYELGKGTGINKQPSMIGGAQQRQPSMVLGGHAINNRQPSLINRTKSIARGVSSQYKFSRKNSNEHSSLSRKMSRSPSKMIGNDPNAGNAMGSMVMSSTQGSILPMSEMESGEGGGLNGSQAQGGEGGEGGEGGMNEKEEDEYEIIGIVDTDTPEDIVKRMKQQKIDEEVHWREWDQVYYILLLFFFLFFLFLLSFPSSFSLFFSIFFLFSCLIYFFYLYRWFMKMN